MFTMNRAGIKYFTAIILFNLFVFLLFWIIFLKTSLVKTDAGYTYKVKNGSSFKAVAADLHAQHFLAHPALFNFLVFLRNDAKHLKAGEYFFPRGTTPSSLIKQLATGHGMILHEFIIVPGETFLAVRTELNNDPSLQHKTKNLTDDAIMKKLHAQVLTPEGQFFPDTYYFAADTADTTLLKRAYRAMQDKLSLAWESRTADLPFQNSYQALIAASIVEKEAYLEDERPKIASVLINRLKKNIILQFDPTVIYGLGARYRGAIYKQDLSDASNLYNTYVYKGLPPSPIAMPSLESIKAVMDPDKDDFLYFVATGKGGRHQFSRTLNQHNIAVGHARNYHPVGFNFGLLKKYLHKHVVLNVSMQRAPLN